MGCASSNPLVNSGKNFIENAKESANEFATKGEHVIQGKIVIYYVGLQFIYINIYLFFDFNRWICKFQIKALLVGF